MTTLLNKTTALTLLNKEYPNLKNWDINIEKQFLAGPGRVSNAFLCIAQSPNAPFKKFVAKAAPPHAENISSIISEHRSLVFAAKGSFSFPKLLFQDHVPTSLLLIEFLDGTNAHTAIENGVNVSKIFELIGKTTHALHQIPTPHFGELNNKPEDWSTHMIRKILQNLATSKTVIDQELHVQTSRLVEASLPALVEPNEPRLIHRDIYVSNFLINNALTEASIIDFGMARGGRPFYDLAKFYILDLYHYPIAKSSFLEGYFQGNAIPSDFTPLLKVYLLRELLGMIIFFDALGEYKPKKHAIKVLHELVNGKGTITQLVN